MAADPHPFFEVRMHDGRLESCTCGRSMGKVIVALAGIVLLALLVLTGELSGTDILEFLPVLPKF